MTSLFIEGGKYTPLISFNTGSNIFEITGESYSENSDSFYQPVIEWLNKFLETNQNPITLNFRLLYFNTSSSRSFFEILEILEEHFMKQKIQVKINWYAKPNDLDMIEDGENYQEHFNHLSFNVTYQQFA